MNALRVTAENYRTFDRLDVDLPSGCVAITGPNGAGKSSLLNAIDVALFAGRGELADLLTVGEDELSLMLEFEHAGELYRVRRGYSARGAGKTTLDFEQYRDGFGVGPDEWLPLTRETAAETQQAICDTIGLSRATFRASSFLRQGDGAAFTEASPRDRKQILAEILGLDLWQRLQDRARADLRLVEDDLVRATAAIEAADTLAAARPDVEKLLAAAELEVEQARDRCAAADARVDQLQQELADAQTTAANVNAARAEHDAAAAAHKQARDLYAAAVAADQELAEKVIELAEFAADADRVPGLEQLVTEARMILDDYRARRTERDRLIAEAAQRDTARDRMVAQALALNDDARVARGKADHLDAHIADAGECDRCGQLLGAEAAARAAASYRAEAVQLDEQAAEIDAAAGAELATIAGLREQADQITLPEALPDLDAYERDLAGCRRAAEQRATVAEQVRQLTDQAARKDELLIDLGLAHHHAEEKRQAFEQLRDTAVDEAGVQSRLLHARAAVASARQLLDQHNATVGRLRGDLDRAVEAEQRAAEQRAAVAEQQARVDLLKLAERAYGRDGIPALIVENAAIPQLELEANRILAELGTPFTVQLRTQKALKTSAELRETLDIVVCDGTHERPYETFSGGERTRLNLALRIALARLLAHRRGAESRLLAIDEPEFLDEQGVGRLADVLRGLGGDFDRVLLVSHHPALAAAFDVSLTVEKDADRSRVGALEAVPA